MSHWRVYTVSDFTVGQQVWVMADQGFRHGEVTKIGRTRVTVRHPRNQQGAIAERPYGMQSIIIGQACSPDSWGWGAVDGTGLWWPFGDKLRRTGHPRLPRINPIKQSGMSC